MAHLTERTALAHCQFLTNKAIKVFQVELEIICCRWQAQGQKG